MRELVFLLEERSAQAMLEGVIPRLGIEVPAIRYIVFDGKSDLKIHLARRLRGYVNPDAVFIVIMDQDAELDCRAVKARLRAMCVSAGRPGALIRIFCRELEALYLADLKAVEAAFGIGGLAKRQREARYRTPDGIVSPSRELAALTKGRYQKIGGSRMMGVLLDIDNERSPSFRTLISGIRWACRSAEPSP